MKLMGIDCSTNSLAFGIIEDGDLIEYGEFFFEGADLYKRLLDARLKCEAVADMFKVDFVVFEQAVMVNNKSVVIKLANMFGVVMSVILEGGAKVVEVSPIPWQTHIGNPVIKGKEKTALLMNHPEIKTRSQTASFIRNYRKNITKKFVFDNYGVDAANDNVSDAIAIASFGYDKLGRENG